MIFRRLTCLAGAAGLIACGASDAGTNQSGSAPQSSAPGDLTPASVNPEEPSVSSEPAPNVPLDEQPEAEDAAGSEPLASESLAPEVDPPPAEEPAEFVVEEASEVLVADLAELPQECEAGTPGCDCNPVSFEVATRASCDMRLVDGVEVDGAGYLSVNGEERLVFAMSRWGDGHVIAWCDSTSGIELMEEFPGWEYLGQSETPRIAVIGSHWGCDDRTSYPYWANQMPDEYVGNPQKLAEDWDVIMLCGFHMGIDPDAETLPDDPEALWPDDLQPTLTSFVKDYGKGLYMVMDYYGNVVRDYDLVHMNDISRDAGFEFLPSNLPWGDASATFALDCVPDVPSAIR